jgi:cation transport ATPase
MWLVSRYERAGCPRAAAEQMRSRRATAPGRWRQGLRTLAVATRLLGEDEYAEWDQRYQAAAAQLEGRDEALADLAGEVEADLELVGVTAIEDKLQAGVPEAIQTLLDAGVKARARGVSNSNRCCA